MAVKQRILKNVYFECIHCNLDNVLSILIFLAIFVLLLADVVYDQSMYR